VPKKNQKVRCHVFTMTADIPPPLSEAHKFVLADFMSKVTLYICKTKQIYCIHIYNHGPHDWIQITEANRVDLAAYYQLKHALAWQAGNPSHAHHAK